MIFMVASAIFFDIRFLHNCNKATSTSKAHHFSRRRCEDNILVVITKAYNNNNNCYSGIIKANYSLLDLVLTQIHSPCYKTYIELKLNLSVTSAISPGKLFQLLITLLLNECFLRSVLDRYLNNLN